jgi:hypothetical protein
MREVLEELFKGNAHTNLYFIKEKYNESLENRSD